MTGGCLWSFVPLLLLLQLYTVVREPITYMLHETSEVAAKIVSVIKEASPDLFEGNSFYGQMTAAPLISKFAEQLKAALPELSETTLAGSTSASWALTLVSPPASTFSPGIPTAGKTSALSCCRCSPPAHRCSVC
jgi:hypothetical protein